MIAVIFQGGADNQGYLPVFQVFPKLVCITFLNRQSDLRKLMDKKWIQFCYFSGTTMRRNTNGEILCLGSVQKVHGAEGFFLNFLHTPCHIKVKKTSRGRI